MYKTSAGGFLQGQKCEDIQFVVQRIVSVQKMQEVGKFFRAFEPIDMDERHIRRDFCVGCRRRSKHNRYKAVASNYEWLVK